MPYKTIKCFDKEVMLVVLHKLHSNTFDPQQALYAEWEYQCEDQLRPNKSKEVWDILGQGSGGAKKNQCLNPSGMLDRLFEIDTHFCIWISDSEAI